MKKFMDFGRIGIKKLCGFIFWIATIVNLAISSAIGYYTYLTNTYVRTINHGNYYSSANVNNLPLAIFHGIIYLIIATLLLRLACEIIYIVLNFFKSNTKENVEQSIS